jgi:hypothetical protein
MKATRLIIEPEAEAELEEAADRYESNVPGLGLAFLLEMRSRTRDVLETPEGNAARVAEFLRIAPTRDANVLYGTANPIAGGIYGWLLKVPDTP